MKAPNGWKGQSVRHSNAKRFGRAGGNYATQLKIGTKVEREHANTLKYIKSHPNTPLKTAEQLVASDHLKEDRAYYSKLKKMEHPKKKVNKKLTAPLEKKSTVLPIQFKIIVPSTKDKNKELTKKEFDERIQTTAKDLSKKFGGETTIKAQGGYVSNDGELIEEPTAIIECSMTKEQYNKNKKSLSNYIKKKQKNWGQETIGYSFEQEFLMYPKFD